MNRFIKIALCIISVAILAVSCHRKPLGCSIYDTVALVPIDIDWSNLSAPPTNVRVLVYDENSDGELYDRFLYEHNDNSPQAYLPLPAGRYSVIIVNEARGDLENMSIAYEENFLTTSFYVQESPEAIDDPIDGSQVYLDELDELATMYVKDITITEEMIYSNFIKSGNTYASGTTTAETYTKSGSEVTDYTDESLLPSTALVGIKPERKDIHMYVELEVEGIDNAVLPVLVDLENVADGYIVSTDKNTMSAANMQFYMNNRYTEDDDTGANVMTLSSEITLFGTLGDRLSVADYTADEPLQFVLRFKLTNGETEQRTLVITDIDESAISSDETQGYIRFKFSLQAMGEDALPDVDGSTGGDGSGGGGIDDSNLSSGLDPWGKEEDEDLVIDGN